MPIQKISFLGQTVMAVGVVQTDRQTDTHTDIPRTDQRLKTYEIFFLILYFYLFMGGLINVFAILQIIACVIILLSNHSLVKTIYQFTVKWQPWYLRTYSSAKDYINRTYIPAETLLGRVLLLVGLGSEKILQRWIEAPKLAYT